MTDQSKTEYDDKIAEIKEQEYQLCQQREGLEQLRAELLCPFKVGDVLTDKKGSKAVLKRISASSWSRGYSMFGARLRKDNSEGRIAELYEWNEWGKEL